MDSLRRELEYLKQDNQFTDLKKDFNSLVGRCQNQCQITEAKIRYLKSLKVSEGVVHRMNEITKKDISIAFARNSTIQEPILEISCKIALMENKFDQAKRSALETCQQTMEEEFKCKCDQLKQELDSTQIELDNMEILQAKVCSEKSAQETQLKAKYVDKLEENLGEITEVLEQKKGEWECLMRSQMEKEQALFKSSRELQEESQKNVDIMVPQAKVACLEEQHLVRQAKIKKALADAKQQWRKEHERDIKQWTRKRKLYQSELSRIDGELSECKHKLRKVVRKTKGVTKFVKDLDQ